MNKEIKKYIMMQNMLVCGKGGPFQILPIMRSIKNYYKHNYTINKSESFANVDITHMHSLLIAKQYVANGMRPVIVTTVSDNFDGTSVESSAGMHDDMINLRTNFHRTIMPTLLPVNKSDIIYTPIVTVIRDESMNINKDGMYRVGLITASPINQPELINDEFMVSDYMLMTELLETVFQTAHQGQHDVIIFSDFGCKINQSSLSDMVDIFNLLILKYGYLFKNIIFSIPTLDQTDRVYYAYFMKKIVRPQDMGNDPDIINFGNMQNDEMKSLMNEVSKMSETLKLPN